MGFFSGIIRGIKKAVKGVTKAVKKVVKGIATVGKKIWKGVKKVAKGFSKALGKLGPLASIAIGFIPGFQGLWASSGIWGAIGKGAITGFITSGGKLKGALVGAVGGGIGYGINAGMDAYGKGVDNLLTQNPNATISEKITAGFKSVGTSTTDGFSNMYKSAGDVLAGDYSKINYLEANPLTGEMTSIYDAPKVGQPKTYDTGFGYEGDKGLYKAGTDDHDAWLARQDGTISGDNILEGANTYKQKTTSYGEMRGYSQRTMMKASIDGGEAGAIRQAKAFGKDMQVGKDFYKDYTSTIQGTPGSTTYQRQMSEIYDYADATNTGLEQGRSLWEQTGGADKSMSFDWSGGTTEPYKYTAEGLKATRSSGLGGTPTYISQQAPTTTKKASKGNAIADAAKSLFGSDASSDYSLPFSTADEDQYSASGGLMAMTGGTGTALDFASDYGGALGGSAYAKQMGEQAQRRYKIG